MSDTFPIQKPIYNTRITPKTNVKVVKFGDGYEQRITEGLNQIALTVNLVFEVTQTEAESAVIFLNNSILTGASFLYTLPNETVARKFVCDSYPRTIPYVNRARLTCVFREVFEP